MRRGGGGRRRQSGCAPQALCSPGEGAAGAIKRDLDERYRQRGVRNEGE